MSEYIIEIESFETVEQARAWAKKHIITRGKKIINAVSREVEVIEI